MTETDAAQYGEHYYANYFGGRPYEPDDPAWPAFFGSVADLIVEDIAPARTLDVGCAYGFLVNELRKRGVDAKGFDFSDYAIGRAADIDDSLPEHVWVASAVDPIEGRYDLVTCIEMIEHLEDADARVALRNITEVTDAVLLSSTPGDFAEPTHVNVRPVEYWAELFAGLGFWRDHDIDTTRLAPWSGLFRRGTRNPRQLVQGYERNRIRLHTERSELRDEVVRLNAELAQQQRAAELPNGERERLLAELDTARARNATLEGESAEIRRELLTSRQATVNAEAEAAEAKAELHLHIVELQHLQLYHDKIEDRVVGLREQAARTEAVTEELAGVKSSTSWRVMWGLLAPYRALKTRLLGHG